MFVGRADILLVDDDQNKPEELYLPEYESYFISALDSINANYEHWDLERNEGILPTPLTDYETIIWYTAESDTNTLTDYDIANLTDFLNNGGNLFISGQNIGAELGDSTFYSDYLHSQFISDSYDGTPIYAVEGIEGDPIGDGLMIVIGGDYGSGADNQVSPDVIAPTNGAYKIFNYSMTDEYGAGVRWEGAYKVVYLPFSFEAILNDFQREDLMERILGWFGIDLSITDESIFDIPEQFLLHQNYPNPFNPTTTIAFTIPKNSQVYLGIYDITGKLIKTLIDAPIEAGYHTVVWDGTDDNGRSVSSGVYFYKLKSKGYEETKKMLLLK